MSGVGFGKPVILINNHTLAALNRMGPMSAQMLRDQYRLALRKAFLEACAYEVRAINAHRVVPTIDHSQLLEFYKPFIRDMAFPVIDADLGINTLLVGANRPALVIEDIARSIADVGAARLLLAQSVRANLEGGDCLYVPASDGYPRGTLFVGPKLRAAHANSHDTQSTWAKKLSIARDTLIPELQVQLGGKVDVVQVAPMFDASLYYYHLDQHLHYLADTRTLLVLNMALFSPESAEALRAACNRAEIKFVNLDYDVRPDIFKHFCDELRACDEKGAIKADSFPVHAEILKHLMGFAKSAPDFLKALIGGPLKEQTNVVANFIRLVVDPTCFNYPKFFEVLDLLTQSVSPKALLMEMRKALLTPFAPTINFVSAGREVPVVGPVMSTELSRAVREALGSEGYQLRNYENLTLGNSNYDTVFAQAVADQLVGKFPTVDRVNLTKTHVSHQSVSCLGVAALSRLLSEIEVTH